MDPFPVASIALPVCSIARPVWSVAGIVRCVSPSVDVDNRLVWRLAEWGGRVADRVAWGSRSVA